MGSRKIYDNLLPTHQSVDVHETHRTKLDSGKLLYKHLDENASIRMNLVR